MKQKQMFKTKCPCIDDNNVKCKNNMSDKQMKQYGMCQRCADLLWSFMTKNKPFVFKETK